MYGISSLYFPRIAFTSTISIKLNVCDENLSETSCNVKDVSQHSSFGGIVFSLMFLVIFLGASFDVLISQLII